MPSDFLVSMTQNTAGQRMQTLENWESEMAAKFLRRTERTSGRNHTRKAAQQNVDSEQNTGYSNQDSVDVDQNVKCD